MIAKRLERGDNGQHRDQAEHDACARDEPEFGQAEEVRRRKEIECGGCRERAGRNGWPASNEGALHGGVECLRRLPFVMIAGDEVNAKVNAESYEGYREDGGEDIQAPDQEFGYSESAQDCGEHRQSCKCDLAGMTKEEEKDKEYQAERGERDIGNLVLDDLQVAIGEGWEAGHPDGDALEVGEDLSARVEERLHHGAEEFDVVLAFGVGTRQEENHPPLFPHEVTVGVVGDGQRQSAGHERGKEFDRVIAVLPHV